MTNPALRNEAAPAVRRREIVGWAMFDFANSSYTTLIVTVAFSVYFTKLVAPGDQADFLWGLGILISNLVVMATSPIVGATADDSGRKKFFLAATYLLCVAGTATLFWVKPGQVTLGLTLFVISNIAYAMGENLAGAFLPEISTPKNIGRISGFGWGLGYFGGLACLAACWPLLAGGFTSDNVDNLRLAWLVTAAFFLISGLPTFLFLRERAPRPAAWSFVASARAGFGHLAETARAIGHFTELVRFLTVFFLFSCGLMTIIAFASIFAERTLGFTSGELIVLFMALQLFSAGGAFVFGAIQDRLGARSTIQISLVLWIAVSVAAYFCQTKSFFWAIAIAAGLGIGSLQSASRGLVGLFSPVAKSGEFFAFWGLAGKGAYMLGPFVFGALSSWSGSQRIAILANGLFFVLGLIGMQLVREERGLAAASAWNERAEGASTSPTP
ncbi:MAG: MFS transporter [Acidobacteriota bacterium]